MTIVVGIPGPQGAPGLSLQGTYNPNTTYTQGQAVNYEGACWAALQSVQGVTPGTAPLQWMLVVEAPALAPLARSPLPQQIVRARFFAVMAHGCRVRYRI
jgi:hypothetical protein